MSIHIKYLNNHDNSNYLLVKISKVIAKWIISSFPKTCLGKMLFHFFKTSYEVRTVTQFSHYFSNIKYTLYKKLVDCLDTSGFLNDYNFFSWKLKIRFVLCLDKKIILKNI